MSVGKYKNGISLYVLETVPYKEYDFYGNERVVTSARNKGIQLVPDHFDEPTYTAGDKMYYEIRGEYFDQGLYDAAYDDIMGGAVHTGSPWGGESVMKKLYGKVIMRRVYDRVHRENRAQPVILDEVEKERRTLYEY